MSRSEPLIIEHVAALSAVGNDAASTYAAMRARFNNHHETDFSDQDWNPIVGSRAAVDPYIFGEGRLVEMAITAMRETLESAQLGAQHLSNIPILFCIAEETRISSPKDGFALLKRIAKKIDAELHPDCIVLPFGRAAGLIALKNAQVLIYENDCAQSLIVAADSLIDADLLTYLDRANQILTPENSNGFIPGEAASACLLRKPKHDDTGLWWLGSGFTTTDPNAHLPKGKKKLPIDGQELAFAMKLAMEDAELAAENVAVRIADINGTDASFKESALAEPIAFPSSEVPLPTLWLPAESIGEVGAAWATIAYGWIAHAARHHYLPEPTAMVHATNDAGLRAASVFEFRI
jgi:3-oxoacyl-[acyl-carrier-protein] synthase I